MRLNRDKVKKTLELKGWTQSDLAEKTGFSRQWISQILEEDKDVRLSTVEMLANALDYDAKDLLVNG